MTLPRTVRDTRDTALTCAAATVLLFAVSIGSVAMRPDRPVSNFAVAAAAVGVVAATLTVLFGLVWLVRAAHRRHRLALFTLAAERDELDGPFPLPRSGR
jgi:threonine/homoserine/homoserine lactone efflux protein